MAASGSASKSSTEKKERARSKPKRPVVIALPEDVLSAMTAAEPLSRVPRIAEAAPAAEAKEVKEEPAKVEAPKANEPKKETYASGTPSPAAKKILDEKGIDTASSVRTMKRLQEEGKLGRALVVSHDHHTSRIRLACHRQGLICYTVPAEQKYLLRKEPYYIAREVAGFFFYALTYR